jgi:hypothetical protein
MERPYTETPFQTASGAGPLQFKRNLNVVQAPAPSHKETRFQTGSGAGPLQFKRNLNVVQALAPSRLVKICRPVTKEGERFTCQVRKLPNAV